MLDLGPQTLHVDIDEPSVSRMTIAPHLLEEDLAGEHLTGAARKAHEKVKLERGERKHFSGSRNRVANDVDDNIADGQGSGPGIVVTANPGADSGDEFLGLERLHDVVVSPGFQSHDHIDRVAFRRQHHDWHS